MAFINVLPNDFNSSTPTHKVFILSACMFNDSMIGNPQASCVGEIDL